MRDRKLIEDWVNGWKDVEEYKNSLAAASLEVLLDIRDLLANPTEK